jgi:hypothetical protein
VSLNGQIIALDYNTPAIDEMITGDPNSSPGIAPPVGSQ